jgi:hypothetical protein
VLLVLVLALACTIALSGGFIAGVIAGVAMARERRDAGGIAPHEAARLVYRPAEEIVLELRGPLPGRRA